MHREHDVSAFFKHRQKHRGLMFFFKNRLKIASLRIGKHRIVKKSEHRPPLWAGGPIREGQVRIGIKQFCSTEPGGFKPGGHHLDLL